MSDPDAEQMKLCRAMINELCEEFNKTLDACTQNVTGDDHQDTSTPLIRRCFSHNSGEDSIPSLSLGSYNPPSGNTSSETNTFLSPNGSATAQVLGTKRVEKLPCTYFTGIADRFEDLNLRADAIPSVAFLGELLQAFLDETKSRMRLL
eukprot:sb/3473609/